MQGILKKSYSYMEYLRPKADKKSINLRVFQKLFIERGLSNDDSEDRYGKDQRQLTINKVLLIAKRDEACLYVPLLCP